MKNSRILALCSFIAVLLNIMIVAQANARFYSPYVDLEDLEDKKQQKHKVQSTKTPDFKNLFIIPPHLKNKKLQNHIKRAYFEGMDIDYNEDVPNVQAFQRRLLLFCDWCGLVVQNSIQHEQGSNNLEDDLNEELKHLSQVQKNLRRIQALAERIDQFSSAY
ncbi:UNKNOWN [Stylonychia lemnae]|uniref:Uncharacterized protein n=1 Tax=Stylonychia lemnae TaxID=5949 RepID=A0A077ZXV6_STYLE|nr:UNKNOWN [Stylonychia lemnae]|eukprot:CDW74422.1 UNKNOWN [Stylonychia lemnae]